MNRYILIILVLIGIVPETYAQYYNLSGKVISKKDNTPIEFVTVSLSGNNLWAITDENGEFELKNVPSGKNQLNTHVLGYAKTTTEVIIQNHITNFILYISEDNLSLNEVVITAQQRNDNLTTSYNIDRTTLDHAQVLNITDIQSLLPGGKTSTDLNLAKSDDRFALRSASVTEKGNASFGTAVEVNGVRLQNNSTFDETKSIDTRNISSINIESIEVITGIPSVEYGDLSNGIIKINTKKGKSPWQIELATKPNTKQIGLSKGFLLGAKAGILNTNIEHTKSISDLASPHTSYDRNAFLVDYTKVFNTNNKPLTLLVGVAGNIGGYNSKSDPDAFKDTYTKKRDNTFRANFRLNWLLDNSWITNLELSGSVSYSDKFSKMNANKSSSSAQPLIHSTEEGYFIATDYNEDPNAPIIVGPTGYWYELSYYDNKPINYTAKLKADWIRKFGNITNRVLIGVDFSKSGNKGKGRYYDDMRYAPTWRKYQYKDVPFMDNYALYIEDKITLPVNTLSTLEVTGGVRSDITHIKQSEYGTVSNLSPRINTKYTFWKDTDKLFKDLSIYAGWGKAVKLPSFEILYPSPSYSDKLAFAPGTPEDGNTFYAYYTIPYKAIYNPDLKWQYSNQIEVGIETNIKGTKIMISAYQNKTHNPYIATNVYTPYSYNLTTQAAAEECIIPVNNRIYNINRQTGIVTVADKTGVYSDQQLNYLTRDTYHSNKMYTNGSTVTRRGIDWIVDFPQISAIRTSIRLDGNFYYYKGIEESTIAYMPNSTITMTDGSPYKYVGYYAGNMGTLSNALLTSNSNISPQSASTGMSSANGSISKQVNTNLTITTHIPKIRLIVSLKLEASFYKYTKNLSEYRGGSRGAALEDSGDLFSTDTDIYGRNKYVAVYPLYYTSWEDPDTKISFIEKFAWAKENDKSLYDELSHLVVKSSTNYFFNPKRISAYYSANFSVTKEIGNHVSLSFYANNFFNSLAKVKFSDNDTEDTIYNNSTYIPRFYYGLSLRIKL